MWDGNPIAQEHARSATLKLLKCSQQEFSDANLSKKDQEEPMSNISQRWWASTGEIISEWKEHGRIITLSFKEDDGQCWKLDAHATMLQGGASTIELFFDYREKCLIGSPIPEKFEDLYKSRIRKKLSEAMREQSWEPTSLQKSIIRSTLEWYEGVRWVSGRASRSQYPRIDLSTLVEIMEKELSPRYLYKNPNGINDTYLPQAASLFLFDDYRAMMEDFVIALFSYWKEELERDWRFHKFSYKDIMLLGSNPPSMNEMKRLISILALDNGGESNDQEVCWYVPMDVERLIEIESLEEFESYLRRGSKLRSWPTAPIAPKKLKNLRFYDGEKNPIEKVKKTLLAHADRMGNVQGRCEGIANILGYQLTHPEVLSIMMLLEETGEFFGNIDPSKLTFEGKMPLEALM